MRYTHFKLRFYLLLAIGVLLATLAGAQGSSTLQELNVLGKLKIPIYNALPAAGGFKQGSVIYQYSGTDSGVYIRSYTGPVWNKVWPVAGTGGTVVDTFYHKFTFLPGDSSKVLFYRSDRVDTLSLADAITGGNDSALNYTLDSISRPQGEWLFSGPGRKLTSSPYFLWSNALRKVTINSLNVSYGGDHVRFAVNGAAHISDLYLDGQVINISKPTSSTYPIGWNYTTKQIEKYTMWPKGVVSYSKNAGLDSNILVLDDGTRLAVKDNTGSGGVSAMAAVGGTPNANAATISAGTLTLQPANESFPGVLTTATQHIAGSKYFRNQLFINDGPTNYGSLRGGGSYFEVESAAFRELHLNRSNNQPVIIRGGAASFSSSGNTLGSTAVNGNLNLTSVGVFTLDNATSTGGRFRIGANSQTSLSDLGTTPPTMLTSVLFQFESTTKGILVPRLSTTQRNAVTNLATGLQLFDNTLLQPYYYDGSLWQATTGMTFGTAAPTSTPVSRGNWYLDYTNKKMYYATGTSSSADWTMAGGGSSSDTTKMNTMPVSGTLFALSSIPDGAERNYFTTSGAASIASGSNELTLNGIATVATTNIVNVPLDMANEKWVQVARFRCNVTTGTQRIGLGTRPSNTANINRGFTYTFDMSSGVDKGKGFIFTGNAGTFTQRAVSAALPLSNNDVVELTVERNGYTFNCKSKNITTGDSVTVSYDYPITSTSEPVMLPTSRPAIYQLNQANQTLLSWSFTDNTPVNPYLLIIGDSKTAGHNATAASGRFVTQLQSAHADSVFAFSGYGDELTDAIKWLPLIRKVRPKNVVIALGSNDVRNSRTEVAIVENLSRIYEACKYVNANVFFLGMGESTINQSYLWQQATTIVGSANMILTYPALAGDGVHLSNTAAHTTVKAAIEAKLF